MSPADHAAGAQASPNGARHRAGPDLLPDFCSLPMTLGVVLSGELLAILLVLASPRPLADFWLRLGPMSLLVLVIALSSAVALCRLRPALAGLDKRLAALLALGVITTTALGVALAAVHLVPWAESGGLLPADGRQGLLVRVGLIAAIVGALGLRYLYLHRLWRAQMDAVANARFQMLQARIRPHFLFNSMNTIASLTQTDPRLAEEITEDLADLFRASLSADAQSTTLKEELDLTRRYLHIEAQRLGERMAVRWDLAGLPDDALVPPLILQPLVENAVYHGIQPSAEPGRIEIVGRWRRGVVTVSIRNTLPGSGAGTVRAHKGNRMAFSNVAQRMEAMFPGAARVTSAQVDGDYLVRLTFPHPWRK